MKETRKEAELEAGKPLNCMCTLENHWGGVVKIKSFEHKFMKLDPNGLRNVSLKDGEVSKAFKVFSYSKVPYYDYWSLSFSDNKNSYKLSGSFYCNIEEKDNGKTIRATIRGSDKKLIVEMPKSSGCKKSITTA